MVTHDTLTVTIKLTTTSRLLHLTVYCVIPVTTRRVICTISGSYINKSTLGVVVGLIHTDLVCSAWPTAAQYI